jgi:DNA-binding transcriptional ArsR family regulator
MAGLTNCVDATRILVVQAVAQIGDVETLQTLAQPLRLKILETLREPASAAGVARALGETRQKVNYHLKELERVQLVRPVGEHRIDNIIERLYEAAARAFVVSPRVTWADSRRALTIAQQVSLSNLVSLGERLQRSAAELLDRAAFDGEAVSSAAVEVDVRFASDEERTEFLRAYLRAVGPLLKQYGAASGAPYRVVLAAYPNPSSQEKS